MQTAIIESLRETTDGQEAERILRACTHCGFCTATCPTYQLTGDERDSPRGRIYLIKQTLEGAEPTARTQFHLDRCLTCRACETTCPSGVEYARLADIGRGLVDSQVERPPRERAIRWGLRHIVAHRRRFAFLVALGRAMSPLLVGRLAPLRDKIPPRRTSTGQDSHSTTAHPRRMLMLQGCVQPSAAPNTNAAARRVFDRLGISLIEAETAGCCGALHQHLSHRETAREQARRNIDAWWPYIADGAEALVMTASGCGAQVAEYGHLLRDDPAYADKAARVTELTHDVSDILAKQDLSGLGDIGTGRRVAYHPPCTLQNAPGLHDHVAAILAQAGFKLTHVGDAHLCCGSAGSYSILQPEMAGELRRHKLDNLESGTPDVIATANIGCQLHLEAATGVPVRHWIELLA
ncbi:glycolate oxidase subunit GlcF [Salinisphaera sp. Q1T1-3]|uniref:glycolate oxidase subunit GlcF n=1 Tax=Salinisphaera sp. Q1T1-3 TaxID=2321229 RepID=UPI000E75212B|nr:glycolate oxidase subunit GlcF [Salinisphaera sp. Q1T1-3]RJS92676.1 glycolate oxidase iron-sulfur subunit [Salinisphaera sp. Q1T1-3]